MPDTEVWALHAQRLQRDDEIVVALPNGYAQSTSPARCAPTITRGLSLASEVYAGKDHLTLPPLFFTRGLLGALRVPQTRAP